MKNLVASIILLTLIFLLGCTPNRVIGNVAKKTLLSGRMENAHIGISIYDPSKKKYWYNHQHDHYFVPASNVKIFTTYAALKYLGNRLKGLKYEEHDNTIIIEGTGDPTFLHPDFEKQPILEFLRGKKHILINTENWKANRWGAGWSWDDYNEDYMAERSALPVYGNVVKISKDTGLSMVGKVLISPSFFKDSLVYDDDQNISDSFLVIRSLDKNLFQKKPSSTLFRQAQIPFATNGFETSRRLLRDTLKTDVRAGYYEIKNPGIVISHPLDSVLKPMMHHSDNFLAEQLLLMVSNEVLGVMNYKENIDILLKTDLIDLPQKPRWVDGSGLSRYNLFTPQDFVFVLNKLQDEFGLGRMKNIFPTGNEGSLKNFYVADSNFIFAKTGSMSGIYAISGFLYTRKNKLIVFSVIVNNYITSSSHVKRAVEQFLKTVRNKH